MPNLDEGEVVTTTTIQTITNKTFSGAVSFVTGGSRIGITSDTIPLVPTGLIQVVNNQVSTALRVSSTWEGTTEAPFQNHDNSLWETFNRTVSDSSNQSWSVSAPNAYNDIPAGVHDSGERVGVYGWATSVNIPGQFTHAGRLRSQIGVRGRAGFQGDANPSPITARIDTAVGVQGEIRGDSPDAIIDFARAGQFISAGAATTIQNNAAVYAEASGGQTSNWSFYGQSGNLYNQGQGYFGEGSVASSQSACVLSARGAVPNALEFGPASPSGFGSNIGGTSGSGFPFVAFCCEADGTGDAFTTRGLKGTVVYNDLNGGLVFARVSGANAAEQALTESGKFDSNGNFSLRSNLTVLTGSAIFGSGSQSQARIKVRHAGNCIEFGHPNPSGYGSNFGATTVSGFPFVAFNAEADPTGNTFTTRGRPGVVVSSDLNGSLVFSRLTDPNAQGQSLTRTASFDPEGRLILSSLPTYTDNAAAVAASLVPGTVYKTVTGELLVVV